MARHSDYRPGSPCWFALGVDDEQVLAAYVDLLGWRLESETPLTRVARVEGGVACGVAPSRGRPGVTVFLACDDVGTALRRAPDHGLTPLGPALPLPGVGRLGFVRDLDGQVVGLFHGEREAVVAVDEPGAVCAVWRPAGGAPAHVWGAVLGAGDDPPWPPVTVTDRVDRWTPVFRGAPRGPHGGVPRGPHGTAPHVVLHPMPDGTTIGLAGADGEAADASGGPAGATATEAVTPGTPPAPAGTAGPGS